MLVSLAVILSGVLGWKIYERRTKQAGVPHGIVRFQGGGTFEFPVLGASRYRPVLEKIYGNGVQDETGRIVEALLVLEKADKSVRVEVRGHTVGYLPPDLATEYRRRLVEAGHLNAKVACRARVTTRLGTLDCNDFAIRLDLPPKHLH